MEKNLAIIMILLDSLEIHLFITISKHVLIFCIVRFLMKRISIATEFSFAYQTLTATNLYLLVRQTNTHKDLILTLHTSKDHHNKGTLTKYY